MLRSLPRGLRTSNSSMPSSRSTTRAVRITRPAITNTLIGVRPSTSSFSVVSVVAMSRRGTLRWKRQTLPTPSTGLSLAASPLSRTGVSEAHAGPSQRLVRLRVLTLSPLETSCPSRSSSSSTVPTSSTSTMGAMEVCSQTPICTMKMSSWLSSSPSTHTLQATHRSAASAPTRSPLPPVSMSRPTRTCRPTTSP